MNSTVHDITDVKKSRKFTLPSLKTTAKVAALAVFGTAVVLVAVDKLTHNSQDSDTEETSNA